MKILRKNCVRCETLIDPSKVDQGTMLYTCPGCNSVLSIYEERDFVGQEKEIKQPEGIRYEYLGDDLHVYMDDLPTGDMLRSVFGTAFLMAIVFFFVALSGNVLFIWAVFIFGTLLWILNLVFYSRLENRTYEILLNSYRVQFFEKLLGFKRKMKEVKSYEVDRIRIETKESQGNPERSKTIFVIQTKQYKQIKPFHPSSGKEVQLRYLKFLMDSYLNIRERISDVQN